MWFFLSRRLRQWVLLAVLVPMAGRLLRGVGGRLEQRGGSTRLTRGINGAAGLASRRSRRGGRR